MASYLPVLQSFLLLHLTFIVFPNLCATTDRHYYVKPTTSGCTPTQEPCHTLNEYAVNSSQFFPPHNRANVTLWFIPGQHDFTHMLSIIGQYHVALLGVQNAESDSVTVDCKIFGLSGINSSHNVVLTLKRLRLIGCALFNDMSDRNPSSVVDISHIIGKSVYLSMSNIAGVTRIDNSSFQGRFSLATCTPDQQLMQQPLNQLSQFYILNSKFQVDYIQIHVGDVGCNSALMIEDSEITGGGNYYAFIQSYKNWASTLVFRNVNVSTMAIYFFGFARASIINCCFQQCLQTALTTYNSTLHFFGNSVFKNNIGYRGGAMALYFGSTAVVENNTHITFENNRAQHTGGAIYVENNCVNYPVSFCSPCALQVNMGSASSKDYINVSLTFSNNSARSSGDAIYGVEFDQCRYQQQARTGEEVLNFTNIPQSVSDASASLSIITSDPKQVCHCTSDALQCEGKGILLYPGEVYNISIAVIGDRRGRVEGTVYSTLLIQNGSEFIPLHSSKPEPMQIGNDCGLLQHQLLTESELAKIFHIISVDGNPISGNVKSSTGQASFSRCGSCPLGNEYLLVLDITMQRCPSGFMFSSSMRKCKCINLLDGIVKCYISGQLFERNSSVWIGLTENNDTIVNTHCPFDYCIDSTTNVSLSDPNKQCDNNRAGVLCGQCLTNYSLALGSNRCLMKCHSNVFIVQILAFALAAILLIFFIQWLDLTVAKGTLNGLIFYANIVKANEALCFSNREQNIFTMFIAWFNLDLGVETCFCRGLDAYWKAWLQFVFPFYLWALMGVIYLLLRCSSVAQKIFGTNNCVPVLSTLILLSYSKLLRNIITIFSFTFLDYENGSSKTVWLFDASKDYFGLEHGFLFMFAFLVLCAWLLYTLVLLFDPFLIRFTNYRWILKLKHFLDAYNGVLKDNHRYSVGLLLAVRAVVILITGILYGLNVTDNYLLLIIASLGLLMYRIAAGGNYRVSYLTSLENANIVNLALLASISLYVRYRGGDQKFVVYTSIGLAITQFVVIVIVHAIYAIRRSKLYQKLYSRWCRFSKQPTVVDDDTCPYSAMSSERHSDDRQLSKSENLNHQRFSKYRESVVELL